MYGIEVIITNQPHTVMEFTPFEDLSIEEQLRTYISDMHKDAYGFRPNLSNYSGLSESELREELDRLAEIVEEEIERDVKRREQSVKDFEKLVADTIELGAGDRATALRWILQGEEVEVRGEMDIEGFLYRKGIIHTDYGKELKHELLGMMTSSLSYYSLG